MQIMVLLLMILAIGAQLDIRPSVSREAHQDMQRAIAHQLALTHAHALAVCTRPADQVVPVGTCTVGELHLGLGTPGGELSRSVFPTFWDGAALVTTWAAAPGRPDGPGMIAAALLDVTDGSIMTGTYVAAEGTVAGRVLSGRGHGLAVVVPADLRAGLRDGYPVMLSCTQDPCTMER